MEDPAFITRRTVTLILAYVYHYTCKFLPGRCLSATNLQRMVNWIGQPAPALRTLRAHKSLAVHVSLLHAAKLLDYQSGIWTVLPAAFDWLHAEPQAQLARLLASIEGTEWGRSLEALGLSETLPIDYREYTRQTLSRQRGQVLTDNGQATWMTAEDEQWRLLLPPTLPLAITFHLLQLGQWSPDQPLRCTPVTLVRAARRGYGQGTIETILAQATGHPVSVELSRQLSRWLGREDTYQLRPVFLLSTKRPEQLAEIAENRRLHTRFHKQISPRHAIVSPDIVTPLARWLAKQGYLLDTLDSKTTPNSKADPAYTWLGLRLLIGLGQLIDLPFRPPISTLQVVAATLSTTVVTELELRAQAILDDLRQAIRGRDAFFPARETATVQFVETVKLAIEREQYLDIRYQSLVDERPYPRRVLPLRLEQRGALHYMHAYCTLAEANRIFRLDRIDTCHVVEG